MAAAGTSSRRCWVHNAGSVFGSALLVDYVLHIATSIAAAGERHFFVPSATPDLGQASLRGGRDPRTHHARRPWRSRVRDVSRAGVPRVPGHARAGHRRRDPVPRRRPPGDGAARDDRIRRAWRRSAPVAWRLLLARACYSLGGGTYTIEAVGRGPAHHARAARADGRRTMFYMAVSLASPPGSFVCFLLWHVELEAGKTARKRVAPGEDGRRPARGRFLIVTLLSEGALLVVAAQAGFIDGPRVLATWPWTRGCAPVRRAVGAGPRRRTGSC